MFTTKNSDLKRKLAKRSIFAACAVKRFFVRVVLLCTVAHTLETNLLRVNNVGKDSPKRETLKSTSNAGMKMAPKAGQGLSIASFIVSVAI